MQNRFHDRDFDRWPPPQADAVDYDPVDVRRCVAWLILGLAVMGTFALLAVV